ncbi:MAG TPA: hypothetical protein DCM86_11335, partial [Verrucomicrobiales bacterium]|nr:hypothetical protein [Verrucomicrobiales bacterium]
AEKARTAAARADWAGVIEASGHAAEALPPSDTPLRMELEMDRADARVRKGELPESISDLERLLAEAGENRDLPARTLQRLRSQLASSQYYAAWLMRLEGAPSAEWLERAEAARQQFRLLAEQSHSNSLPRLAADYEQNLESVIRLERMDLSELKGLPLPRDCEACKNCSQQSRKQRTSRSPQKTGGPPPETPKDARKAGQGSRPQEPGS